MRMLFNPFGSNRPKLVYFTTYFFHPDNRGLENTCSTPSAINKELKTKISSKFHMNCIQIKLMYLNWMDHKSWSTLTNSFSGVTLVWMMVRFIEYCIMENSLPKSITSHSYLISQEIKIVSLLDIPTASTNTGLL